MGSYSYDRDVYSSSSYDSWGASSYSKTKFNNTTMSDSLDPAKKKIVSNSKNPIIIALDVTGSNIDFARLVYDKLPMFYGEIEQKGYLDDFDICICAVGDAKYDNYPLQIGTPAKGLEIDSWIEKLVLEGEGGGNKYESYDLMAHYLNYYTEFRKDAKPIIFFIADEKPFDYIMENECKRLGLMYKDYNPFKMLNEKYNNNVYVMLNKYCGGYDYFDDAWKSVMPSEHTIKIREEKAIVDLMLGVISLQKNELDSYTIDMKNRGQTVNRIEGVKSSLQALANSVALSTNIETDLPSQMTLTMKNKGRRL